MMSQMSDSMSDSMQISQESNIVGCFPVLYYSMERVYWCDLSDNAAHVIYIPWAISARSFDPGTKILGAVFRIIFNEEAYEPLAWVKLGLLHNKQSTVMAGLIFRVTCPVTLVE